MLDIYKAFQVQLLVQLGRPMLSLKDIYNLHYDLFRILHLKLDFESWHGNLPDLHCKPRMLDVPNLIIHLNWLPMFECNVVRCGSMNGYQRDLCLKRSDHVLKIWCPFQVWYQHNWEYPDDHLMSTIIFTLIGNEMFMWAPKTMRKVAMAWFGFTNNLVLIVCSIY